MSGGEKNISANISIRMNAQQYLQYVRGKGYRGRTVENANGLTRAFKEFVQAQQGRLKMPGEWAFFPEKNTHKFVNMANADPRTKKKMEALLINRKVQRRTEKKQVKQEGVKKKSARIIQKAIREFLSFKLRETNRAQNNRYRTLDISYTTSGINLNKHDSDYYFRKVYNQLIANSRGSTFVRILMINNITGHTSSTHLLNTITYAEFESALNKLLQSNQEAGLKDVSFVLQMRNVPDGGGSVEIPQFLHKRGMTLIINDDDKCGQRCLVMSEANPKLREHLKVRLGQFDNLTNEMCKKIGIDRRMTFIDFEVYSKMVEKHIIIITQFNTILYETDDEYEQQLYIYYDQKQSHYHYINDINAFTNDSKRQYKWCFKCNKSILRKNFAIHKCKGFNCKCCNIHFGTQELLDKHFEKPQWATCGKCYLPCPNKECLDEHTNKCKGEVKRCKNCKKWIDSEHYDTHRCGDVKCHNCGQYFPDGTHRCFLQKYEPPKIEENPNIWAYDFEAEFDDKMKHTVNLTIASKLYSDEKVVFENLEEFVKWTLTQKNCTFIAHNAKAYDGWLAHQYLIKHSRTRPNKIILAGNKVMYMKVLSNRFIDSLNHVAQSLESFPKTFGLDKSKFKKGFFPYLFNTPENKHYVGSIPDAKYFSPNEMSIDKRKEFNEWYANQKDVVYDFKKELYEYCLSDVQILKQSMEVYRDEGIQMNGIDPLKSTTIASYCMKSYKTHNMPENTLSILNKEEYDFCKAGFFGGRTEVFKLYTNKPCKYLDVQSLYPTVQFYDELPCGIPKFNKDLNITLNTKDEMIKFCDDNYGYIECDVECPKNLLIPVLPEKRDLKLFFDLIDKKKKVFTSIELKKAVQKGYKITYVYSTMTFEKSKTLFKDYISKNLKTKVESSGYDGDDIQGFIQEHKDRYGFEMDIDNIKSNPGKRLLSKIQLNSLWGKLGQKYDMNQHKYITKPDEWFKMLSKHQKGEISLEGEQSLDEDTLFIQYRDLKEENTPLNNTNVALAGFVTANARLRLYSELEKLNERVCYCDTDSIIFEYDANGYNIPQGKYLGEWEDETPGYFIEEFVATAPKSYAYRYNNKSVCKFKGFTLNYENSEKINFVSLKHMIDDKQNLTARVMDFVKNKKTGEINTKYSEKIATFMFDKRVIVDDYNTIPIGFTY